VHVFTSEYRIQNTCEDQRPQTWQSVYSNSSRDIILSIVKAWRGGGGDVGIQEWTPQMCMVLLIEKEGISRDFKSKIVSQIPVINTPARAQQLCVYSCLLGKQPITGVGYTAIIQDHTTRRNDLPMHSPPIVSCNQLILPTCRRVRGTSVLRRAKAAVFD
jgi:hypothetical protein